MPLQRHDFLDCYVIVPCSSFDAILDILAIKTGSGRALKTPTTAPVNDKDDDDHEHDDDDEMFIKFVITVNDMWPAMTFRYSTFNTQSVLKY